MRSLSHISTLLVIAGFCLFSFSSPSAYCQGDGLQRADSLIQLASGIKYQNFSKADSLYHLAQQTLARAGYHKNPTLWIHLLHQRIVTALFHNKIVDAKDYLATAYESIDKHSDALGDSADSLRTETRLYDANYAFVIGNYAEALYKLDNAESYFLKRSANRNTCQALYNILQFQATIYQLQGEFESCIDRYLGSNKYYECHRPRNEVANYILVNRNIGVAYSRMGSYSKARDYFFAAKSNLDAMSDSSKNTFIVRNHALVLYNSLADFYIKQQKFDSARYMYGLAMPMLKDNPSYLARLNEGLARVAHNEKKFEEAEKLYFKALELTLSSRGEKSYVTSYLYILMSGLYQDKKEATRALFYMQKALNSLSVTEINVGDFRENPPVRSSHTPKIMITTLNKKANLLCQLYAQTKSMDFLDAAWKTSHLALQLLDSTRNEFSLEKDKVVLGEEAIQVYETAIHLASYFYTATTNPKYLEDMFVLMDKSKGAVLMDHLKHVKNFSGIPSELLDRERQLKAELSAAERELYTAEVKKAETSLFRENLGRIKQEYSQLLANIKTTAPNYYKLRIGNEQLTVPDVQKKLKADEALLEYFFGDTILYMAAVTPSGLKIHTVSADPVRERIYALREIILEQSALTDHARMQQWHNLSAVLYEQLVKPFASHLKSSRHLIVVPHDVLTYLPFEMLVEENGDYLLSRFSVSYACSAGLLQQQNSMKVSGNFFAGFHADYSDQPEFPLLPGAVTEVSAIKEIFGFRSSVFSAATADDFARDASNFKIIHLALHSQVNDEKPLFSRLVFTRTPEGKSDITANDLYNMELNSEIAVLSACETGLGKLQRGEGMMSLSRAFMYANVPSTVISLWKVPDQTTKILMTRFYEALKDGQTKDEALRFAKLELIREHPEMSHPFFWAGFIVNGKTDPIAMSNLADHEKFAASLLAVILLGVGLLVIRRKRQRLV
jgi:CHAT domain-containing protein